MTHTMETSKVIIRPNLLIESGLCEPSVILNREFVISGGTWGLVNSLRASDAFMRQ